MFVLLQSAAFGGVFTGFAVAADFERGFARRLMLAAPNRLGILAGYLLAGLVRALIVGVLLFVVALIVGMQIDGGGGRPVRADRAGAARQPRRRAVRVRRRVPRCARSRPGRRCRCRSSWSCSSPRSTCRSPCSRAGSTAVAKVNPFTALIEGGRDLISGQSFDALLAYGIAAALAALFCVWAVRGLRKAEAAGG